MAGRLSSTLRPPPPTPPRKGEGKARRRARSLARFTPSGFRARPVNLSGLVLKAAFIVVAALECGGAAMAGDCPGSLLFEAPQWAATRPGATLSYRYTRKSENQA